MADTGYKVYLVEKKPSIGGKMAQLDKTFPTMDCSICILAPKMSDVGKHPNIELITNSEVTKVSGYIGPQKAQNQISGPVNSMCYNEKKSKFRIFKNPSYLRMIYAIARLKILASSPASGS